VVLIIVLNAAVAFVQERHTEDRGRGARSGCSVNRYLLWAIAGELAIAAVFVFAPCQALLAAPSHPHATCCCC